MVSDYVNVVKWSSWLKVSAIENSVHMIGCFVIAVSVDLLYMDVDNEYL